MAAPPTLDGFGCPVLASDAACLAGIVRYHECVLGYARFEDWAKILEVAPQSAMATLLAADYLQQAAGGMGPAGNAELDAVATLPLLREREKGYLRALRRMAVSDLKGAYEHWLAVVAEFPSDLFAVKRGQFCCIVTGDSGGLLSIAALAKPAGQLGRYCAGLLAFGLEQTGDWAGAESVARRALAADAEAAAPDASDDGWLLHALVHSLYFQGHSSECIGLLTVQSKTWRRERWHPFLFTHLWYHSCDYQYPRCDFQRPSCNRRYLCCDYGTRITQP